MKLKVSTLLPIIMSMASTKIVLGSKVVRKVFLTKISPLYQYNVGWCYFSEYYTITLFCS